MNMFSTLAGRLVFTPTPQPEPTPEPPKYRREPTKTRAFCTRCRLEKLPSEFNIQRDKRQNARLSSWCKKCHSAYMVEYKKRKRGEK